MPALSQKKSVHGFASAARLRDGFTLLELMVVIAIMGILVSALVLNLNTTRASRDIKIGQDLLVSNIRKTQSYTLSARTLPTGEQVQYYVMKFDLQNNPNQYTIQAIYNADSNPAKLQDVETVNLPLNIKISSIDINQRPAIPSDQTPTSGCVLAAFAAPFGKLIFNDGCNIVSPPNIDGANLNDDYNKIVSFQINVACGVGNYGVPAICTASTDSVMVITLSDAAGTVSRKILVNGITGTVCPTLDNTSPTPVCQGSY